MTKISDWVRLGAAACLLLVVAMALPRSTAVAQQTIGTHGRNLPLLNGRNAWSTMASGQAQRTCESFVNFGGVGDGSTANDSAWAAAVVALANGGCLYFPGGKYRFASTMRFAYPSSGLVSLTLIGAGADASILYWPNAGGGIALSMSTCQSSLHVRDLSLTTGVADGGAGLQIAQSGNCVPTTITQNDVDRVTFRGDDGGGATDYWSVGLKETALWNININGSLFWGSSGGFGIGVLVQGTDATHYTAIVNLDEDYFEYEQIGFLYGSFTQGVNIDNSNFGNGVTGIQSNAGEKGILAQLFVTNCQFNTNGAQIEEATPIYNSQFVNNNFFVPGSQIGIQFLTSVAPFQLVNNWFDGQALAGNYGVVVGAAASSTVNGGTIEGNIFYSIAAGINLQSGSQGVLILGNEFLNGVPTPIVNNGTGHIIQSNPGYNPVGPAAISVGGSPFTYTAGSSPESVYISGGAVGNVTEGGATLLTATNASVDLDPLQSIVVTYTSPPTMTKVIH
jgi:hypothetical protein